MIELTGELKTEAMRAEARALLEHLHLGGTLAKVAEDHFALTRYFVRRADPALVQALIDQGFIEEVGGTYATPSHDKFWTISLKGIEEIGGTKIYGSAELREELGITQNALDLRAKRGVSVKPDAVVGNVRIFTGGKKVTPFRTKDVAKLAGISRRTVELHILKRLLYGRLIGEPVGKGVMVFTKNQVADYMVWLKTKKKGQQIKF